MNAPSPLSSLVARLAKPGRIRLAEACVPAALLADDVPAGAEVDRDGSVVVDILMENGRIAAITPALANACDDSIAVDGRHVWPLLIDAHAHLDKGHTVGRAADSGGTHPGARTATTADRRAHWNAEDIIMRMEFGLATANAHGVAAIRTHLDSHAGQAEISWRVFTEMRERWKGRITLQAAGLVPLDAYREGYGPYLADIVADHGGLLGGVTRASGGTHHGGLDDIDALLDRLFSLAKERELCIDLHVDEAAQANALTHVARATIRHGYEGRVTCGHCCSLALLREEELRDRIALIADAGLSIITLPTVNMHLQDREDNRTPRWRGVAPIKELRSAGVPVAVAGDNCRDPFFAYGDHDMLDTWRESVRILHLDHPYAGSTALAGPVPAKIMGIEAGMIGIGLAANLMVLDAWSMDQVIARAHSNRLIIRNGVYVNAALPSYSMLRGSHTRQRETA